MTITREDIFREIEPQIGEAYDRHITAVARDTISLDPYSLVPIQDYEQIRVGFNEHVNEWATNGIDILPLVKSALLVDAATEENLPWYTALLTGGFESWVDWNARWTAEEKSHGEIMVRDIEARGIMDMTTEWLRARELNMVKGIHPEIPTPQDGIAYVVTQELLTRAAHFGLARLMDSAGRKSLRAVGADEGRHYQFYVSAAHALAIAFPDLALMAMRRQHEGDNFGMPGQKGIPAYEALAKIIALGGMFDAITVLEAQKKTIDEAGLLQAVPVSDEGKQALDWAYGISERTDPTWERKTKLMSKIRERATKSIDPNGLKPVILGTTVELVDNEFKAII